MQAFCFASVWSMIEKPFIGDFSGSFASTLLDIEPRYPANTIPASAQRLKGLNQTETERAHNSGRNDDDPSFPYFYV